MIPLSDQLLVSLEPGLELPLVLGHLLDEFLDLQLSLDDLGLIIGAVRDLEVLDQVGCIGLILDSNCIVLFGRGLLIGRRILDLAN